MKHIYVLLTILFGAVSSALGETMQDLCPTFCKIPSWGNSGLSYNVNATPWHFTLDVCGDTTGLQVQWYTYQYGQTLSDTVPYRGQGCNTVHACYPATKASDVVLNQLVYYVCVVKTQNCPQGIMYKEASVIVNTSCGTMGNQFTISTSKTAYTEGSKITLTAYYNGQGGFHYYTWYKDGVALDSTAEHGIWNDPNNYNYSVLTIPEAQLSDAGRYSVTVEDGTDSNGTPCTMTVSNPKNIMVSPLQPETCEEVVYRKWDNMLFVDNGKKEYVAYQWFKDKQMMQGETCQYLYTGGITLQADGHRYYVVASKANGQQVCSCEHAFDDFPRSVDTYTHHTSSRAALYTNMGCLVGEWKDIPASLQVAPGIYVWHLTDMEGHTWQTKIVYRE